MKRPPAIFAFLMLFLSAVELSDAHPMGNFSTNRYASLQIQSGELRLRYRIDFAEIPTAQQMHLLDANDDGVVSESEKTAYLAKLSQELADNLIVQIDGRPVKCSISGSTLQLRPGAADLPTLLVTLDLRCSIPSELLKIGSSIVVSYEDQNYSDRTGWREVVAKTSLVAQVISSDVPQRELSDALERYPANPTDAPPQDVRARITFRMTATTAAESTNSPMASPSTPARNSGTPRDRFTDLIAARELSGSFLILAFVVAFGLGAFHALSPGHGKTVVAAYLVGSRGTPRHAMLLGAVVTLTHVSGVLALGLVVLFASRYVMTERVYPWLAFISGMLIVLLGVWQFSRRFAVAYVRRNGLEPPRFGHHHGPGGHTHDMPDRITPGSLIALGVSGGIVPCPSALVVMLSAIALHRVVLGLGLIVVFSAGLAAVLIAIGLSMLYARRLADRLELGSGWLRRVSIVSPLLVAVVGIAIAAQAVKAGRLI